MFNNYFFFPKPKYVAIRPIHKNKNICFYEKLFKFKYLDISIPTRTFLNFKIITTITPFYYAFFVLFWDFKKKKFKPKKYTNVQYFFFFYLRDKKSKMFYWHLNLWFYVFSIKTHKRLTKKISKAFKKFQPIIRKKYDLKFTFKGKFKGKGNNKKKKWTLKQGFLSFVKKKNNRKIVLNTNRTAHGAISSRTIF